MQNAFPPIPYQEWKESKNTLHLFCQIIGKTRMALMPKQNHWWHVTLYVSSRGLTTRPVPVGDRVFEIELNLRDHRLHISVSDGTESGFSLAGLSVSAFYRLFNAELKRLGIVAPIQARPYDTMSTIPFASDYAHAGCDHEYAARYWQALLNINSVFEEFRGRFIGKSTPVQLYWHSFDLALTRFSGREAPREGGTNADREAYSHEVISFGFWPGDENVQFPAFYSYVYPEPAGLAQEPLKPAAAMWNVSEGGSMALLAYDDVRSAANPRQAIMDFLNSAYEAGARRAGWDTARFDLANFEAKKD